MPDWTGITRHGAGYRASVSQGRGRPPLRRHFPIETPVQAMQAWRADQAAKRRLTRKPRATSGTLAWDIRHRYLPAVRALTTYRTRVQDLDRWIAVFGERWRDQITSADIRAQRDQWLITPRATGRPPYAASTINHWLRALSNVWTVLDGRRAPNPVREVPEVPEPDARPRALAYAVIEQILAAMPDRGRPAKGSRPTISLSKLRLRVLAYTGLTYSQLARLTRADVHLEQGTMFVARRAKGKGASARLLPLLPAAVEAFRALDAARGWGQFSGASLRKSFLRAARHCGIQGIRPYDLRHSFGTLVYRSTGSREAAKDLLQHQAISTTARYTLAAVDAVLAAHLGKVDPHR